MNETVDLSNRILREKQNKVLSTNIKKDITIFNVLGDYSGYLTEEEYQDALAVVNDILTDSEPTHSGEVKLFKTVSDMNNSTGNIENDLAIVYRSITEGVLEYHSYNNLTIKNNFKLDTPISGDTQYIEIYGYNNGLYAGISGTITSSACELSISTNEIQESISYTSSNGIDYTSSSDSIKLNLEATMELTAEMTEWKDYYSSIVTSTLNYFEGLYIYKNNNYELCENQFTLSNSGELLPPLSAYGKSGIVTGTDNIYNNIPIDVYFEKTRNLNIPFIGTRYYNNDVNLELDNKFYKLTEDINGQYEFVKANFYNITEIENLYGNLSAYVISSNYLYAMTSIWNSAESKIIKMNLSTKNTEVLDNITFTSSELRTYNVNSIQVTKDLGFIAIANSSNIKVYRFKNGNKETILDTSCHTCCYPRLAYWNDKLWIYFLTSSTKAAIYTLVDIDSQATFAKNVNFELPVKSSTTTVGIIPTENRLYFVSVDGWGMASDRYSNFDNVDKSGNWSANRRSGLVFIDVAIGSDSNLYFLGSGKAKYKITATGCTTGTWTNFPSINGYYNVSSSTIEWTYGPKKGSYCTLSPYETHYTILGNSSSNLHIGDTRMNIGSTEYRLMDDSYLYISFIPFNTMFTCKHNIYKTDEHHVMSIDKVYFVIADFIKCNIEESDEQGNAIQLDNNILMKIE